MTRDALDDVLATLARVHDADLGEFPPWELTREVAGLVAGPPMEGGGRSAHPSIGIRDYTPKRRMLLAMGAVLLAGAVAVVLVNPFRDTDPSRGPGVRIEAPPTTRAPTLPAALCGSVFPKELNVPDEYAGPFTDVAPRSDDPLGPGQLRQRWESGTGTVELRWPADADRLASRVGSQPPSAPGVMSGATFQLETLPDGRFSKTSVFNGLPIDAAGLAPECQTWSWQIVDTDASQVSTVESRFRGRLFRLGVDDVVSSTIEVATSPTTATCQVPDGVPPSPSRSEDVPDFGVYPDARAAILAFTEARVTLPQAGYVEMLLPDGTRAFGWEIPQRGGYSVVIHAIPVPGGWTIDHSETSGC